MATPSASDDDQTLSPNYIRRMKLGLDEKALAVLETQVAQLMLTTTALEIQLAKIQASLEVARNSLEIAMRRRDDLLLHVQGQRAALGALERFPDELLVEIFDYLASLPRVSWASGPVKITRQRARAPFICAAVCQRWRRAALAAPHLWHYVAIPRLTQAQADGTHFSAYVETMLARSRSASLSVIFDLIDDSGLKHHAKLLGMLAPQLRRFMSFSARLSTQHAIHAVLDCLRGPSPMLVLVCIGVRPGKNYDLVTLDQNVTPGALVPRYLCHAPMLTTVWIENMPFSWGHDHEAMPSLELLTIMQKTLTDSFWTTVKAAAPSLASLVIFAREPPAAPSAPIELPLLDFLNVGRDAWKLLERFPQALAVPRLATLRISKGQPQVLDAFFSKLSTCLVSLDLFGVLIDEDSIPALCHLASLTTLELHDATVTTRLFARLCQAQECMWPRLEALKIYGLTLQPANGDDLVRLVRTRNAQGGPHQHWPQDVPPWSAINSVVFSGDHNVPRWDVAEINHLLGQN